MPERGQERVASRPDTSRDAREAQIDAVVLDHLQRRHSGESVSDAAVIADHQHLMPELAERLHEIAQLSALESGLKADQTGSGSSPHSAWALRIRCPHCCESSEVPADADFDRITCARCGCCFNLVREADPSQATSSCGRIAQFELVERLGYGSFGTVWRAHDTELDRTVAVKIPRRGQLDPDEIEKFLREARAAAQLNHKSIAHVYEVGREADTVYIVNELIRGVSLSDWRTTRRPTFRQTAELCAKIADALHHAHESGVVHRDLKPHNVMLDDEDEPHLMDFGLARREAGEVTMTLDGQILGTPAYMSPEQARGEGHQADRRSDLYSLGVILFELLTGELPFRGSARRLIHQTIHDEAPGPRKLNSNVPKDLETICLKCLEKNAAHRYGTATEVSAELRRYLAGEPIRARPISAAGRLGRWCRKNRMAATVIGLVVFLATAGPLMAIRQFKLASDEAAARQEAVKARDHERRLTFRMAFDRGLAQCEQGRVGIGMLWMARALELVPPEQTAMQRVIRANLSAWRRELHRLEAVFPHRKGVLNAAFSPDGELVVTASKDKSAQLWEARSGAPLGQPMLHDGDVHEVVFTRDGSHILTANYDRTVRLWNTDTCELVRPFPHQGDVPAAAFAPDDSWFVTGGSERRVRRWNTNTGEIIDELPKKHSHMIHDIAVSADGSRILTACHDKNVRLWDSASRELLATFRHEARVPAADFTRADGGRIVTGDSDGNVFLWNAAVAIADDDRKLETAEEEFIESWRHQGGVHRLTVSPDRSRVLTGSFDNTAQLLDAETLSPIGAPFEHQAAVPGVAFSPDGSRIVTACEDNAARMWRPATGQSPRVVQHECKGEHEAVYTSDGRYILSKTNDTTAAVRDAATGTIIAQFPQPGGIRSVAVSPDGSYILTGNDNASAMLWETATSELAFSDFDHSDGVWAVAFSPDGEQMLTGDFGGSVQIREVSTGALVGQPRELGTRVWGATFSPDGTRFAVASGDKVVRVFDRDLGYIPRTLAQHNDAAVAVVFSPDGSLVATGSHDNTVRIWDAGTGSSFSGPMRHRGAIWYPVTVAFSNDGQTIVTGCDDRTVRIWDVTTGEPIGPPLIHKAGVRMATFAPGDRGQIVTGTALGTVRFWDVTISPMGGDVERITCWLQMITGMELDVESGEAKPLDVASWQQRRTRLDRIGGPPR